MVEHEYPEVAELGEVADVTRTGSVSPPKRYDRRDRWDDNSRGWAT